MSYQTHAAAYTAFKDFYQEELEARFTDTLSKL